MVVKENIGMIVDLKAMALAIPGSEYDPLRFQGLILRMEKPEASFIIFESGVLIVTDIVSEAKAKKALKDKFKLTLHNDLSLVALQGPESPKILEKLINGVSILKFMNGKKFFYNNNIIIDD